MCRVMFWNWSIKSWPGRGTTVCHFDRYHDADRPGPRRYARPDHAGAHLAFSVAASGAWQFILGQQHHRWASFARARSAGRFVVLAVDRSIRRGILVRLATSEEGLADSAEA